MSLEFTTDNWKREVLDHKGAVLVDFWATWCPPCRAIAPTIEKLAKDRADVKIGKLDVDDNAVAADYRISSIPTLLFIENGREVHRHVGSIDEKGLTKLMDEKFSK